MAHLFDHPFGWRAAIGASHRRDDAEGATVATTVLDLEIGARAVAARVIHGRGQKRLLTRDVAHVDETVIRYFVRFEYHLGDAVLVRVAHHPLDARKAGQFFGTALGVASGDQDGRLGIAAMYASQGLPQILVGRRRDRATVQNDYFRRFDIRGGFEAFLAQGALDGRAIGLSGPATEILNEEATPHYPMIKRGVREIPNPARVGNARSTCGVEGDPLF